MLVCNNKYILYIIDDKEREMKKVFLVIIACFSIFQIFAQTSIFDATRNGDTSAINFLIKINPDTVNSTNQRGHTPLILATYHNQTQAVSHLIKNGANINYTFSQGSAIHGATYKGYLEIVQILVDNGINIDIPDQNGTTPLIYATIFNHIGIVKLLFGKGANINHKDNTGNSASDYAKSLQNKILIDLFKTYKNGKN